VELARETGKDLTVVTCEPGRAARSEKVRNFEPVGVFEVPDTGGLNVYYPPLLEMLDYAFREDFTHVVAATPGPVGLFSMLVARFLKLPIYATYHTQFAQSVGQVTGDDAMVDLAWKFIVWFYNQMDKVYVTSRSAAAELMERGVHRSRITIAPSGVDTEQFHPAKRNGYLKRWSLDEGVTILYVGRIVREKNLNLLIRTFDRLLEKGIRANLVLAGDGPQTEVFRSKLAGRPVVFTGYLEGEDLARLYASCDIFCYPAFRDTFASVVLEAQASGLPTVVADKGGAQDHVIDGETGLVVESDDEEALLAALLSLIQNPSRRRGMGGRARERMEEHSLSKTFEGTWDLYRRAG
jgi:glycosyltransferase involved in cell wall biosynthesis